MKEKLSEIFDIEWGDVSKLGVWTGMRTIEDEQWAVASGCIRPRGKGYQATVTIRSSSVGGVVDLSSSESGPSPVNALSKAVERMRVTMPFVDSFLDGRETQ